MKMKKSKTFSQASFILLILSAFFTLNACSTTKTTTNLPIEDKSPLEAEKILEEKPPLFESEVEVGDKTIEMKSWKVEDMLGDTTGLSNVEKAERYILRGIEYIDFENYEKAFSDFNQAIQLSSLC